MATILIDGESYEVKEGLNLLEAILSVGLDLPYFCWHPAMGSVGSCRQCAVVQYANEEDTRGRLVMGCMTPVADGQRISLNGDTASDFRKGVVESLMVNHPHDCPVCGEGGECHLQDMTVMAGHRERRYRGLKNTHRNQYLGPMLHHEMNRCISCYRCVRFYRDYAGGTDLAALASRDRVYFGRHEEGVLESEFAGNLVEVCPTGVFTDKSLVHDYTRKWDLQSAPSICSACAVGCNTIPGERYGRLKRVHNRYHDQVNGYFLCDRGRFGASWVNDEDRFSFPGRREDDGSFRAVQNEEAIAELASCCADDRRLVGIGSPRASLEVNASLRQYVGAENFCAGFADAERSQLAEVLGILRGGPVPVASIRELESADAVLVLGEDVSNTAPRLALALRQSVRNAGLEMARQMGLADWQDAAIRNLAQQDRSPLYQLTVADTRLDDIAVSTPRLRPDDIARLGFAVAMVLGAKDIDVPGLDADTQSLAADIAGHLKAAKRPMVVSGTACQNIDVIRAAAAIASALHDNNDETRQHYCLPECNSLGQAMLDQAASPGLGEIMARARDGKIDTLLIVENDLFRRAPKHEIEMLLDAVDKVVVVDVSSTATAEHAQLVLPASSALESEGSLVSSEGRVQRYFPVMAAAAARTASWQWLLALSATCSRGTLPAAEHFDQLLEGLIELDCLPGDVRDAAPDSSWRGPVGLKVPRQPHRYSGRTAMRANVSVHEPKQPVDEETSLAFSMEGTGATVPAGMQPFFWSPGWNSNQSLHRFQAEPDGVLKGGTAGVRLFEVGVEDGPTATPIPTQLPEVPAQVSGHWLLLPLYRVFGSEELSARCASVAELAGPAKLEMHPEDAEALGLGSDDGIAVDCPVADCGEFPFRVNSSLPRGCVGFPVGMTATASLQAGSNVPLRRIEGLCRTALIASDAGSADHV